MRENFFEVADDAPDAGKALGGFGEYGLQLRDRVAEVQLSLDGVEGRAGDGLRLAPCREQLLRVALEEREVAFEEAQGIVDLVRDACGQLADRRELLLLNHDDLGLLELAVRLRELDIGLP